MPNLTLRVGPVAGPCIEFGPFDHSLASQGDPTPFEPSSYVKIVAADDRRWTLSGRNGFEGLSLAHFRRHLRRLLNGETDLVLFGDHDFGQIVELTPTGDGRYQLRASNASDDVWDIEIATLGGSDLLQIVAQIDAIESSFGPLTGYCDACGIPPG